METGHTVRKARPKTILTCSFFIILFSCPLAMSGPGEALPSVFLPSEPERKKLFVDSFSFGQLPELPDDGRPSWALEEKTESRLESNRNGVLSIPDFHEFLLPAGSMLPALPDWVNNGNDNDNKSGKSAGSSDNTTTGFASRLQFRSPQDSPLPEIRPVEENYSVELFRNHNASLISKLKRAESISLFMQVAGMAALQAIDAWDTGHRPFANCRDNLKEAWTSAPEWDHDAFQYDYIGHPYTGSITYNLMRSQNGTPLSSWLFSCSQSLIWEYTLEATETHPSIQDLLITSNIGSIIGEGFHRMTIKMKKGGFSPAEKVLLTVINPGYVLNNGYH